MEYGLRRLDHLAKRSAIRKRRARKLALALLLVPAFTTTSHAGELDLDLGLQATHTGWSDDHAGGPTLSASWLFESWVGVNFTGKEHYATVDERYMSYYSVNAIFRKAFDHLRISGTAGVVHQHEEPKPAIDNMPLASAFGVADGIRHRMGARSGIQLAFPFRERAKGDWYVAIDVDATVFAEQTRGPGWMSSAGLSIGFTHDFAKAAPKATPVVVRK